MSDQLTDGGPAFPCEAETGEDGVKRILGVAGMSLRDWFAGQALIGLISATSGMHNKTIELDGGKLAKAAYDAADAMLEAREASNE